MQLDAPNLLVFDGRIVPLAPAKHLPIRKRCRKMSPRQRWEFFSPSGQGRNEYPAAKCDEQLVHLAESHSRAGVAVCSATWHDDQWGGAEYPPGGPDETAMVMSHERIGTGYAVKPHRRWTPPQCVELEDYIDGMDRGEAARRGAYEWPASPSARAIQLHAFYSRAAMRRLADDRGRIGRKKSLQNQKPLEK